MATYMTLEEYAATLKVGDEVTIKYYSITGEKEIKEKILKITKSGTIYLRSKNCKDALRFRKNGKPIKNEQLGDECNVFDLFIHDATKAFVNAEFKLKIGVILPVTEEQFIEANKNIKDIVNTDTAIINCGAYGKGRIYHLEYTKLADSERGRL